MASNASASEVAFVPPLESEPGLVSVSQRYFDIWFRFRVFRANSLTERSECSYSALTLPFTASFTLLM